MKHCNCKNLNDWMICVVCEGRIHKKECTTKLNPNKDCCEERHELLYNRGITKSYIHK